MPIGIRPESSADEVGIGKVTRRAFERHPYSSHTEQFIIGALRKAKALSLSLVAEKEGRVAGHLAMPPVGITVLLGVPGFYGRFGYARSTGLILPDAPAEFFPALPFAASTPRGEIACHDAFFAPS